MEKHFSNLALFAVLLLLLAIPVGSFGLGKVITNGTVLSVQDVRISTEGAQDIGFELFDETTVSGRVIIPLP